MNDSIGIVIKGLRMKHGLTQEEFGKPLFVTKEAVYNWEKGKNSPSKSVIEKIREVYGVDLLDMKGEEKMLKPLDEINDVKELNDEINKVLNLIKYDSAYSQSISYLLCLLLQTITGYVIYYFNIYKHFPGVDKDAYETTWENVAYELKELYNTLDSYPMREYPFHMDDNYDILIDKVKYIVGDQIGSELFESSMKVDAKRYKFGACAEASGYQFLNLYPKEENSLKTSFKVALSQLANVLE